MNISKLNFVRFTKGGMGKRRRGVEIRFTCWVACGALSIAALLSQPASAAAVDGEATSSVKSKPLKHKKTVHVSNKDSVRIKPAKVGAGPLPVSASPEHPALSPADQARAAAYAASAARFDKVYGFKGWDFPFPSYGDTILGDYGGFRSTLAKYGFGFIEYNVEIFANNLLKVPTSGPGPANHIVNGVPQPGSQQYWGQRASFLSGEIPTLTYDMSQWGVPDGQIAIQAQVNNSSAEFYSQTRSNVSNLTWYQTLFNKAVEVKFGLISAGTEYMGGFIGGNLASPFGPSSSIPFQTGFTQAPTSQPMVRTTWHMTDTLYNELGIMRSLPIGGPSGNGFVDDNYYNPSSLRFSVPNSRLLVADEFGYKQQASVNTPQTWIRFGDMYNTSKFTNYQSLENYYTKGLGTPVENRGVSALYFFADRQLYQAAPESPFTAYRGIYFGTTVQYTPPETGAVTQYYEARLYYLGLFESRPFDEFVIDLNHSTLSPYLANLENFLLPLTTGGTQNFRHGSNTATVSYTAKVSSGVYVTLGLGYTDNPSFTYSHNEGHDLNLLASTFVAF